MKIYNSLSKATEPFIPIEPKKVRLYVCGITPYDTTHLGHAFLYVQFDTIVRYLAYKGYHVNYTQNVTDIDDDILTRAKKEKRDWKELGDFWTSRFLSDMHSLNVNIPTNYVKATDSIDTIVKIVTLLIEKGYAYESKGNVYFDITQFPEYGSLSKLSPQQMIILSKERGADPKDPLKKNPLDFVLWQQSKPDEPFWESPWNPPAGGGRPGWHIECSAMVQDYLGEQIDIHGGGGDLIFPHHESEIAQSQSYTGKKPYVKYWMHAAMVRHMGEKMSKSLGNLVMVSDLLKKYSPNAIRWVLLSHHYRESWEFNEKELTEAENTLQRIKKNIIQSSGEEDHRFEEYIEDDFNFPKALEVIISQKQFTTLGFTL